MKTLEMFNPRLGKKSLELGKSRNADELGQAPKQDAKDFLDGGNFTDDFTLVIVESAGPRPVEMST